jgi:hypothetical protein
MIQNLSWVSSKSKLSPTIRGGQMRLMMDRLSNEGCYEVNRVGSSSFTGEKHVLFFIFIFFMHYHWKQYFFEIKWEKYDILLFIINCINNYFFNVLELLYIVLHFLIVIDTCHNMIGCRCVNITDSVIFFNIRDLFVIFA